MTIVVCLFVTINVAIIDAGTIIQTVRVDMFTAVDVVVIDVIGVM